MTATAPRPPAGRYGPEPDARRRRRGVAALWALGVVALAVTVWLGLGVARTPVTWQDVGFRIDGAASVEVVYDVQRIDPSVPVRCRVEALAQNHAQVGVVTADVPAAESRTVRVTTTVRTTEQAVTGVVDRCWVAGDERRGG